MQKYVEGGHKNAFLKISRDSRGEDLFLFEDQYSQSFLGDLFATVTVTITENDILCSPKENQRREGARIGAPSVRQ